VITLLLIAWPAGAAVAVAADLHLMRWALAGRLGQKVQSRTRETHARLGGTRVALVASVALDVLLPPVSLAMSAPSYTRMLLPKRRPRQAPATSLADDGAALNPPVTLLGASGLVLQRPWGAVAALVVACAAAAGAGAGLRLLVPLPALAGAGAWAAVIAWRLAIPGSRPGRWPTARPPWAAGAEAAEREMPAGTLDAERIYLARFASRAGRRGSYVLAWRCQAGARYRGLCRSALVRDEDGYLLVVIGEHVTPAAMGLLGHELAHLSGWRARVQRAAHLARLTGWLLAAWSAGWPWALAAGAAVQAATMLAAWTVEAGCDVHAAREQGTGALIGAVRADAGVHGLMPAGELRLFRAIRYLTGLTTHPPDWLRCLILRALAPGRAPRPSA
jgi:hypothetical protein